VSLASELAETRPRPIGEVDAHEPSEPPITWIEPRSGWQVVDMAELWKYRELLFFLAWRDVKVRYKQSALGAAWAILQPLATMAVFSLFFGRVAASQAPSAVPYPLFVLAGLIPWTFFSNAFGSAGQSVIANERLVTKTYFPRLIIPLSAVGAGLVDFAIASALLAPMMLWFGVAPGASIAWLPVAVLGLLTAALGVGTLLAALTVAFRDFKHVVPFLTQFWLFATPAVYLQADALGPRLGWLLQLNPAHGLIDTFRRSLLGQPVEGPALAASLAVAAAALMVGSLYFRRVERQFADII
jgi:lipopolysaccharide transport system permease protein